MRILVSLLLGTTVLNTVIDGIPHKIRKYARPLKTLHIPDMDLSDLPHSNEYFPTSGIRTVATLIACSSALESINMCRNAIVTEKTKLFLTYALKLNAKNSYSTGTVQEIQLGQCGLTTGELAKLEAARTCANVEKSTHYVPRVSEDAVTTVLTWYESTRIGLMIAQELYECDKDSHAMNLLLYNSWKTSPPLVVPRHVLEPFESLHANMFDNEDEEPEVSQVVATPSNPSTRNQVRTFLSTCSYDHMFVFVILLRLLHN